MSPLRLYARHAIGGLVALLKVRREVGIQILDVCHPSVFGNPFFLACLLSLSLSLFLQIDAAAAGLHPTVEAAVGVHQALLYRMYT